MGRAEGTPAPPKGEYDARNEARVEADPEARGFSREPFEFLCTHGGKRRGGGTRIFGVQPAGFFLPLWPDPRVVPSGPAVTSNVFSAARSNESRKAMRTVGLKAWGRLRVV